MAKACLLLLLALCALPSLGQVPGPIPLGLDTTMPRVLASLVDWGQRPGRSQPVDAVVLHSTHCLGADTFALACVLGQFRRYNVSAHYVIDRQGIAHQLVAEQHTSHHAGLSRLPTGGTQVNSRSIGIELLCTTAQGPTAAQYHCLATLLRQLQRRYSIQCVTSHRRIAPQRKTDPWGMNWAYLRSCMAAARADTTTLMP